MINRELDKIISWCRNKLENRHERPLDLTGKRLEGYKQALLIAMSYLHSLKEE